MSYEALDVDTVVSYLAGVAPVAGRLGADVAATEVGDGNLNLVFIVEGSAGSVVLKQALPYLRVAGDDWPLTRERMRFETAALLRYNEQTPGRAPEVFHHDAEMSLVVMEYLQDHQVMRQPLIDGRRFPNFVDHICDFMAAIHFRSSDLFLTGEEKKAQQVEFSNPALCKIQEDFVYTNPLKTSEENEWNPELDETVRQLRADAELKSHVVAVKDTYMTRGQVLLHGDLHTGSIMVTDEDTKVIDPEFAFYGPIGYDVGTLVANLAINALAHEVHSDADARSATQEYVLGLIPAVWNGYAQRFDAQWAAENNGEMAPDDYWDFPGGAEAFAAYRREYLRTVLADTAGHAGCEMLRRLMGIVTVPELGSIEDLAARAAVERKVAAAARRFIVDRASFTDAEQLAAIVADQFGVA